MVDSYIAVRRWSLWSTVMKLTSFSIIFLMTFMLKICGNKIIVLINMFRCLMVNMIVTVLCELL